ncbi:MAG: hypothetical protein R2939_00305 [Kofleriaceae bacterium]
MCELPGIRRGPIVLSKRDLVDDEWLAALDDEVAAAVAGTFLAAAPRAPVSARTGDGLPVLRAALGDALAALPLRATGGVLRLPIDRVFTVKGHGTVVNGTSPAARSASRR